MTRIERHIGSPQLRVLLCALVLSIGGNSGLAQAATPAAAATATAASVQVETVAARYAPLAQTVRAYGVAAMGPAEMNDINLPFAARITRLYVSAGQRVKRGALLAEALPDPAAALAYQQAVSTAALAKGELARTEQLYQQQLATGSQLSLAQKTLADANAGLAAQQRTGAPGAASKRITAPFDGVVVTLTGAQGAQLAAGASIMQLAHDSAAGNAGAPLKVALAVNPADGLRIRSGTPLTLSALNGAPGSNAAGMRGTVISVGAAIDPQTQLLNLVATIPAASAGILPGMKVQADISISQDPHWIVPRSAVLHDGKGDYLYQIEAAHARRVDVRTMVDNGAVMGVDGSLKSTLGVVSVGNYELQPGTPVRAATGATR